MLAQAPDAGLNLRAVAKEAGYAPGALYTYLAGSDGLALALAIEALSHVLRQQRQRGGSAAQTLMEAAQGLPLDGALIAAVLDPNRRSCEPALERAFNGRVIQLVTALAGGAVGPDRPAQKRAVRQAAEALGLALLARSALLALLGFAPEDFTEALSEADQPSADLRAAP